MRITPQDTAMAIGITAVTAGVFLQFGAAWACMVGGAQLIAMTVLSQFLR